MRDPAWRDGFLPALSHPRLPEAAQHCHGHGRYLMRRCTFIHFDLGSLGAGAAKSRPETLIFSPPRRDPAQSDGFLPAISHPKQPEAVQHCHGRNLMRPSMFIHFHRGSLGTGACLYIVVSCGQNQNCASIVLTFSHHATYLHVIQPMVKL